MDQIVSSKYPCLPLFACLGITELCNLRKPGFSWRRVVDSRGRSLGEPWGSGEASQVFIPGMEGRGARPKTGVGRGRGAASSSSRVARWPASPQANSPCCSINARRIPGIPFLPPAPDPNLFKK